MTQYPLFVVVTPFGLFLIALLFVVAGLLTPSSLRRNGVVRFVGDRLLRLGLPFVVYVLLVQPTVTSALEHHLGDAPGSYWQEYMPEGRIDSGLLWFVGVLLLFSLGYAGWYAVSGGPRPARAHPLPVRSLLLVAGVAAPASFLMRLVYPYGSESGFSDLNLWEWPACLAMFVIGARGCREGWLHDVPQPLARKCRDLTMLAAAAMAALLVVVTSRGAIEDALGGANAAAVVFAMIEAVLTVCGSVWLLSVAQHRLARRYRWGPVLSRSAYGAFLLQTVFLLGFAIMLRPLGLPAEAKALIVAVGGVTCSFAAARLLIRQVPGVSRVF